MDRFEEDQSATGDHVSASTPKDFDSGDLSGLGDLPFTRRRVLSALFALGLSPLLPGCKEDSERAPVLPRPNNNPRNGGLPTTPQYESTPPPVRQVPREQIQQIPEISEADLYKVDIPRLRENLLRTGILVLTHNGDSELENEFKRIVESARELGPVIKRFGSKIVKKRCQPKIITGQDANGNDITENVTPIDCFVVDATDGVLPSNIGDVLRNRKFGLILCAGHVYDIETLANLSDQFRADESFLMLGGCRTADMIGQFHLPTRLVAGTTDSLHTETFTHLAKVSAATIIGRQCNTWPEFFRNLQANYSYELQREPDVYIFPGNPMYVRYVQSR